MTFRLDDWLRLQIGLEDLDIPLIEGESIEADDRREWLITNGSGTYASGSISGANTRRYHGLLVAALQPPVERTMLLTHIDEVVNGEELATNFWAGGGTAPAGFKTIIAYANFPCPTWAYQLEDGVLIKQVTMQPGQEQVAVSYSWEANDGRSSADCKFAVLTSCRSFHAELSGRDDWQFKQESQGQSTRLKAWDDAPELFIGLSCGTWEPQSSWYWNYFWPRELERGLPDGEDAYLAGFVHATIEHGQSMTIAAAVNASPVVSNANDAVIETLEYKLGLLEIAGNPGSLTVCHLVLAADAFIVDRASTEETSVIAGYHWFNDWGRDAMISLPGLTLSTGRTGAARSLLTCFHKFLSQGMLPNNFPDAGSAPAYNTVDATLWWAWALKKYYQATQDLDFVKEMLPALEEVVDWHKRGTRFGIKLDESDGLISCGESGVQLTWMDAKVGDYVVTPRQGKPVEISALWYNFLRVLAELHEVAGSDGARFNIMADSTKAGFQKFWNAKEGYFNDVLEGGDGTSSQLRPNQLLALSLRDDLVSPEQARSALQAVEKHLLTPFGLRSLTTRDPDYKGRYGSGKDSAAQYDRDICYHQGTVWPWLLGPWVDARMNFFGQDDEANVAVIKAQLALLLHHHFQKEAGLGHISEIFDGDPPHKAHGCVAQAWSCAEVLRILTEYPQLTGTQQAVEELAVAGA